MRHLVRWLVLLSILVPSSWPLNTARAVAGEPARVRIGVTADGIMQVTPADLAAAGIDPASVDPRTFAMSSLGRPLAISVAGEVDGRFDDGDRILFFGQRFRGPEMDQKYTDERVYWLEIGGDAGPRIPEIDATPRDGMSPPADVATTIHAEQSVHWWTLHTLTLDTQDTWFWSRLQPPFTAGLGVTATLPYTVPDPAPGHPAQLRLEEISRSLSGANPDHRTTIAVNAVPVLDQTWDGKVRKVFAAMVPAGVLTSGINTVSVGAWTMPGTNGDDVYANYWELDYRRLFRAWQGQFDFRPESTGPQEYLVQGWGSKWVTVWDISDPDRPKQLVGAMPSPEETGFGLRFRAGDPAQAAGEARLWLQEQAGFGRPASIRRRPPAVLRDPEGGADAVIVTHALVRDAAERLAAWHRAHGRRALVVDIQDAYDEFNQGIYHPKAVRAMMQWAAEHWTSPAPAYLTLVGDGHWNFKGFSPERYPPQPNLIPPYLAWADPWQGEVPADTQFGDLTGDGVPEVAVGRLAVNSLAEADVVVDKIVNYNETASTEPWQQRVLFVADNTDPVAGDFPTLSDEIIADYLPSDLSVVRAYLPGSPPAVPATAEQILATRAAISDTLQSGVLMVQYTGHGAPERWAHEFIWRTSDIPGLRNSSRLPVVMTFNCLDGYFAHPVPSTFSIAELMQRQPGGGSVAAISPAGLGLTVDQQAFRRVLMEVMFQSGVREVGTAMTIAKQRYAAASGAMYMVATTTLFGDPALRLPGPAMATRYLPLIQR